MLGSFFSFLELRTMKGKFQESGQLRKELWKHKEAAKNKELLKESHLKTLSELRKESEQSKHKELVDHLPSVGCKHCIKGDPPQPVAVHNHWLTGGLLLRFGLLGKEGGIIGIRM